MQLVTFNNMIARIETLLTEKLGVGGKDLQAKLSRAGRRLPRNVRMAGFLLTETEARCKNPKLSHQIDDEAVAEAYDEIVRYLESVDLKARRGERMLKILASFVINLAVVFGLVMLWVYWQS